MDLVIIEQDDLSHGLWIDWTKSSLTEELCIGQELEILVAAWLSTSVLWLVASMLFIGVRLKSYTLIAGDETPEWWTLWSDEELGTTKNSIGVIH